MIDTSGSTSQKNRISHIREAAKWVINTLSEADFAMVVQFNGAAHSQGEKLLPVRKQASTRTAMQHIYLPLAPPLHTCSSIAVFTIAGVLYCLHTFVSVSCNVDLPFVSCAPAATMVDECVAARVECR